MTAIPCSLSNLFKLHDEDHRNYLTPNQLCLMYDTIRVGGISIAQVLASMDIVCGNTDYIILDELKNVLNEMDRRYFMVQNLQWEFALLDNLHQGAIPIEKAKFLFEAVHGRFFSTSQWNRFLRRRALFDAPLTFAEMEVELCNPPSLGDFNHELSDNRIVEKLAAKQKRNKEKMLRKEKESKQKKEKLENSEEENVRLKSLPTKQKKEVIDDDKAEEGEQNLPLPTSDSKGNESSEKEKEERIKEKNEKRKEKEEKKKKEKIAKRRADHQQLYDQLESAVESRDPDRLEPAIEQYKKGVSRKHDQELLLREAERLLEMLKCSSALHDAMTKRIVSQLESAIEQAKKSGFDQSEEELAGQVAEANNLMLRLKRLEKLRNEVLELKQSTIAELRSYQNPMPVIHNVMKATYLLLSTTEKQTKDWQNIQALLGKTGREGLKRRIGQCNVLKVSLATAKRAKELLGEVDLELIRDVSAGAATFFVWTEGIIEEVENNSKNSLSS